MTDPMVVASDIHRHTSNRSTTAGSIGLRRPRQQQQQREARRNDDSERPRLPWNSSSGTSSSNVAHEVTVNDDGSHTIVETIGATSIATTTASPLLFLLDGVLSRDEVRVSEAMSIITKIYQVNIVAHRYHHHHHHYQQLHHHSSGTTPFINTAAQANFATPHLTLTDTATTTSSDPTTTRVSTHAIHTEYGMESPCTSSASLLIVINVLLQRYPQLARVASDHDGSLPLHFAASLGDVPVAQRILQTYPNAATTPNQKGKIPLHYAAREGRIDMVKYFLRVCPEACSIATDKGKLAIHFAAGDGHTEITSTLVRAYPKSASIPSHKGKLPLHFCARWGYLDIAQELISFYPNAVCALDWEGSLPIHDASREGQYNMAKYLMNLYPDSLRTANLRNEIPLFPAVRSNCMELIVLMIQSWPMSGKHILRNVRLDDHISTWNWDIIELLLRGATNNLRNCPLLQRYQHEPITFRLYNDIPTPVAIETMNTTAAKERKKELKKAYKMAEPDGATTNTTTTFASQQQGQPPSFVVDVSAPTLTGTDTTFLSSTSYMSHSVDDPNHNWNIPSHFASSTSGTHSKLIPDGGNEWNIVSQQLATESIMGVPGSAPQVTSSSSSFAPTSAAAATTSSSASVRCKSPILELNDEKQKMLSKRSRSKMLDTTSDPVDDHRKRNRMMLLPQPRTFIPIHAAFECKASYHVIERTIMECPDDVYRKDDVGRNILHYAVTHCTDPEIVDLVLDRKWNIFTSNNVREIDPMTGLLPLHIAIMNCANVRMIQELLLEYPSSGIEPACPTNTAMMLCTRCGRSCNNYAFLNGEILVDRDHDHEHEQLSYTTTTPIHLATQYNCDVSTIFVLLRIDPSFVIKNRW